MLLAVRISSYGCPREVWRALKKLELLSAAPRLILMHLSCSPNFPRASMTRYTRAKHEQILKFTIRKIVRIIYTLLLNNKNLKHRYVTIKIHLTIRKLKKVRLKMAFKSM